MWRLLVVMLVSILPHELTLLRGKSPKPLELIDKPGFILYDGSVIIMIPWLLLHMKSLPLLFIREPAKILFFRLKWKITLQIMVNYVSLLLQANNTSEEQSI